MRVPGIFSAVIVAVTLAGCSAVPIMNVADTPITTSSSKVLTSAEVRSAIVRAGGTLGWKMADEGPNKLVGTLNLRTHQAVIEIPYSATSYSIKYRSSVNLDEQGGMIHKNYNGWIQNRTREINAQLASA